MGWTWVEVRDGGSGSRGPVGESGSLHRLGKGCWAKGVVWHHNSRDRERREDGSGLRPGQGVPHWGH